MKIDGQGRPVESVTTPTRGGSPSRPSAGASTSSLSVPQDKVELSTASQLSGLKAALNDVPVVDTARVQNIKDAISQGKFHVNAEAIADSLLDSVREILKQRGH